MGLIKAICQLSDPSIRKVLIQASLISGSVFFTTVIGVFFILNRVSTTGIVWIDGPITLLGSGGALFIGLFLFPSLTGMISSFMLERVAVAVEARHYPNLSDTRNEAIWAVMAYAFRFTCISVVLNLGVLLLAVPAMLMTLILTPLIPFVFFFINGYLIGREYFEFVAARRLNPQAVSVLRKRYKKRILMYGIIIAVLMTVPFVNWLMPVIAAAYMVHNFETIRAVDGNYDKPAKGPNGREHYGR